MKYIVHLTDRNGFKKMMEWSDVSLPPYLKFPDVPRMEGWWDSSLAPTTVPFRDRIFYLDCERDGVAYYREY